MFEAEIHVGMRVFLRAKLNNADEACMRIIFFPSLICSLNNQEQNGKTLVLADLPQVLLSELWSMDPGVYSTGNSYGATGQKMYALDCHICMVFQLIIKTVCSLCRGAFKDGECQSKKCRKDAHPVQVVNAK